MSKLVILKLKGDCDRGFWLTLAIEGVIKYSNTEITGNLPPANSLVRQYQDWQSSYRRLEYSLRLKGKLHDPVKGEQDKESYCFEIIIDDYIQRRKQDCRHASLRLKEELNKWLNTTGFKPIQKRLIEQLDPDEQIRFLICTDSRELRKLPWNQWNFLDRYPFSEIALSAEQECQPSLSQSQTPVNQVKILAIFANSSRINLLKDKKQLQDKFPHAKITFLLQPQRQQINKHLREAWDILFFSGHSRTDTQSNRIYINQTDSLTIDEINLAVKKAIEKGLQLAIFNCCDGLELVSELEELSFGQAIVMRELLPEPVAQQFFHYFLSQLAEGIPLYQAVRSARENLQGLEQKFPCASFLPVIFQHPAVDPLTWSNLLGKQLSDRNSLSLAEETEEDRTYLTESPKSELNNRVLPVAIESPHSSRFAVAATSDRNVGKLFQGEAVETNSSPSQSNRSINYLLPLLFKAYLFQSQKLQESSERKNKQKLSKLYLLEISTLTVAALFFSGITYLESISSTTFKPKIYSTISPTIDKPQGESTFMEMDNVPSGKFKYGGSTSWARIRGEIDPVIQSIWPNFKLHYVQHPFLIPSSGMGIKMLLEGQMSFVQSSRPLSAQEYQIAFKQGMILEQIPVAMDGIAFVVNPSLNLPGLTLAQLKDIYTGKVTNWQQVGGPDLEIVPYSKSQRLSGTAQFFAQKVLKSSKFGSQVNFTSSTTIALREVAANQGSIYYASASKLVQQCTVKPLPIGYSVDRLIAPYNLPYIELSQCPARRNQVNHQVFKSGDYPLTRTLFVIVKQNSLSERQAGKTYAELLLSHQGQKLIEKAGMIPISVNLFSPKSKGVQSADNSDPFGEFKIQNEE